MLQLVHIMSGVLTCVSGLVKHHTLTSQSISTRPPRLLGVFIIVIIFHALFIFILTFAVLLSIFSFLTHTRLPRPPNP